jgi:hypothetical protein
VQFIQFDSPDEMRSYLTQANSEANRRLHPMQRTLKFGDCWVQFFDVEKRHFVFGRIHTLDEVHAAEMACGATKAEALKVCRDTEEELTLGLMYGEAFDRDNPEGSLGTTHKANVWPIDQTVFAAAEEANGIVDDMPLWARISLSIGLSGWRAHREAQK